MSAVTLELPDSLHRHLEKLARRHGATLQQLLVSAAAEKVSALDENFLQAEAALGTRAGFDAYLKAAPDAPPLPGDEL